MLAARFALRSLPSSARLMSTSARWSAITKMAMPAMSPTMSEGNLVEWKVKEGESFSAGSVILDIETDKAVMDVEATDDGVLGKIIVQAGTKDVPVGKTIALLAEEGDDISNLEVPKEDADTAPKQEKPAEEAQPAEGPKPAEQAPAQEATGGESGEVHFTKPVFPSVLRLAHEYGITDPEKKIKGTGPHGMLTKGDVLSYLGKAESPYGTASSHHTTVTDLGGGAGARTTKPPVEGGAEAPPAPKPQYDLPSSQVSSMIIDGLGRLSHPAPRPAAQVSDREAWSQMLGGYSHTRRSAARHEAAAKQTLEDVVDRLAR